MARRPSCVAQHREHPAVACRPLTRTRHNGSPRLGSAARSAVSFRRGVACTAQAFPDRNRQPTQLAERSQRDVALESMQLESELREKVSGAVENLGYRVRLASARCSRFADAPCQRSLARVFSLLEETCTATPQVTVGDVAAQAGVKPSDAEAALQALAADTRGTLEVVFAL